MDHLVLEIGLALVLVAAAALLSARLRFSIVPFLIIAGLIAGPHLPTLGFINLSFGKIVEGNFEPNAAGEIIQFLGRMGVLFLLFYLGLEFSVSRLIKSGRSIVTGGVIYIGLNFTLGLIYAAMMGWPLREILVAAGITTISSSAIVAKVLVDLRRTANPETEMILGITMFEDVFLAVYLSVVSGIVLSSATSLGGVLLSAAMALGFILGFIILGRWAAPFLDKMLRISSSEVFLMVIFACLFLVAGLAETIHVAEAIGALLVGSVLAETEHAERIEHLVVPFRDFFGGVFFFSFGLSINPYTLGGAVWPALGAVVLTLIGNTVAGMLAGKSAGLTRQESLNIGFSIAGRGEFSIILANLGKAGNLLPVLQPFTALYVLLLAILGPLLTKESERIYDISSNLFRKRSKVTKQEEPEPANE